MNKMEEPQGNKIIVKRIKDACCGMENGKFYEAVTNSIDYPSYVRVKLPDGTWTTEHWADGFFELIMIVKK